jgi:hypothetical protein
LVSGPKKGERIRYRVVSNSDYLPPIVHIHRHAFVSAKRTEVNDVTFFPKDSTDLMQASQRIDFTILRLSNDPATRIDSAGGTAINTRKPTEIRANTIAPLKGVR